MPVAASDLTPQLVQLLVLFAAAMVGAEIALRLRMPAVVGEIAMGAVIGPSVLNFVPFDADGSPPLVFEVLSELGVVFLMFSVGLHTKVSSIRAIGGTAVRVAVLGVVVPFGLGMGWTSLAGASLATQAFVGCAFVATSVGITARVLEDMKLLHRTESRVILAAAILDDIIAMLLLATVVALVSAKGGNPTLHLTILGIQAAVFLAMIAFVLPKLFRRHSRALSLPITPHSPFTLSILICLGIAVVSAQIGLAAIVGAFLAGTLFADIADEYELEEQMKPLLYFLTPFFFVVTGMKVHLEVFASGPTLLAMCIATGLAVVGKFVGCGLGALKLGKVKAAAIGFGMVPRGEVGIIIAAIGLAAGALSQEMYAVIIAMSLLTSMIAPPIFVALMRAGDHPTR